MSYPIVLAHGVCRFDRIWSDALEIDNSDDPKIDSMHYFKGLRTKLKNQGFVVYHSNVSWSADVKTRASELEENILQILDKESAKKVNIIAHSMGGLDARHMLFNSRNLSGIYKKIASLTTISTPHEGSPFADWGTTQLPYVIPIAQKLGLCLKGFYDLRTDRCRNFNNAPEVIEFEKECEKNIKFQTFAGSQKFWGVFDALKLSYYIIEKKEGENDGLVSVKSAKWRERYFRGILENTDHLNELGWWDPAQIYENEFENELMMRIHNFYLDIARNLP